MNIVDWLKAGFKTEKRSTLKQDAYLAHSFGARPSSSGISITPDLATGIPAVQSCVQLISEMTASLPLCVYRRLADGGREVDLSHPLNALLDQQANSIQTAFEFREQLIASCLLTGNGYALKMIDQRGVVTELIPLHPSDVHVEKLVNGRLRYTYSASGYPVQRFTQDEVLHIRYRSLDGYTGLSPITIARETIGTAIAQQRYEGALFKNGVRPSGIIKYPHALTDDQRRAIKDSVASNHTGPDNSAKLMIFEQGMEFQQISMSQKDADFVQTKKLTLDDIARIFRIPPPAIGILSDATYSNISEQSRMLVRDTLGPWMKRIEQSMNTSLLTPEGRKNYFIEHSAEGLLRGNTKDRFEAHDIGRKGGWLSINEIRSKENMASIKGGDSYFGQDDELRTA